MWLHALKRRPWRATFSLGILIAAVAFALAHASPSYKIASAQLSSDALIEATGEIRASFLTGSRITSQTGRASTFSFFVWGTRESGIAEIHISNSSEGSAVKAVRFKGKLVSNLQGV